MSHTLGGSGESPDAFGGAAAADTPRQANLLGTLSLAVTERLERSVEGAARHGGAAPAALAALFTYLDGSSIEVLRRSLGLTHSAAVRLTDRLSDARLVERSPGSDGRSVSIRLTRDGGRVARRILAERELALTDVLAPLSRHERADLTRLHEKLLGGLTSSRADARHLCRLCDADACGHAEGRCPVTLAANRAEGEAA